MPIESLRKINLMRSISVHPFAVRAVFLSVILVITSVVFFRSMSKANTPSRLGDYTRTAVLRWKPQIEALDQGTNIYEAFNYPNPPIMALILKPVISLQPLPAAATWFLLKVALAGLMVWWSIRFVRGNGPPLSDAVIGLAIVLGLQPILGDLAHGNVNLFIATVVFAALELYRRGRDFACGITLALAIACKVTPALFLPYFVWKRSWKAVLGTVLGLGIWLAIVPGAVLGWQYNQTLLTSWFTRMVKPFVVDGQVTSEHPNQSIPGVVFRLLTHEPSFLTYGEDGNGPPESAGFHTLYDIGTPNARLLVKGMTVGFGLLILLLCRAKTEGEHGMRSGLRLAAEWSLIMLGMLLLSERTWKHHAVTFILPFLVLAYSAFHSISHRTRVFSWIVLGLSTVLMYGQSVLSDRMQDLALVYGMYTAVFLVLTIGIAVILASNENSRQMAAVPFNNS